MKKIRLMSLAALLVSSTMATTMAAQEFKLDHFKFWRVRPTTEKPVGTVLLQGQFDRRPWKALVGFPEYIGNPVDKKKEGIHNEALHYLAYSIKTDQNVAPPPIEVTNQFGPKRPWKLTRPVWLLVPADKRLDEKPGTPPRGADHFVCYAGESSRIVMPVTLLDQFDRMLKKPEEVREFIPAYFCVPVTKQREGRRPEPILDPRTHLAIYMIPKTQFDKRIFTTDQFGRRQLNVVYSEFLAVPSLKAVRR